MLNIKRQLQHTPIYNEINQIVSIETLDIQTVDNLLQSQFIGEGVYGLEILMQKDNMKINAIAPIVHDIENSSTILNYITDRDSIHCYEINLTKPSFMPIKHDNFINEIQKIIPEQVKVYLQILFTKRTDNWQDISIEQYLSYLKGNDYPSKKEPIRNIQESVIELLNNISGNKVKRERIKAIEDKINSNGYRVEIRLVTDGMVKDIVNFENRIASIIGKVSYFNSFKLYRIKNNSEFLENYNQRQFSAISDEQILSENELVSLLIGKYEQTIIVEKEEKNEIVEINNSIYDTATKILPYQKVERVVDKTISDKIASAFKRVKITKNQKVNVTKLEQGSTLQRITIKIPDEINYSDIEKNLKNLKVTLGVESLSIEQGDEPETISFLLPVVDREVVYLKQLLEDNEFVKYASEHILPVILGVDVLGKPFYADITKLPHLLVAGTTGSGKSVFLNVLILVLLIMKKPSELMVYLIDPKKVEFGQFAGFPHVQEVVTDVGKSMLLLQSLVNEMEKRYDKLSKAGYKKLEAYNKHTKNKIPYIVCVIDELADLMMVSAKSVEDSIIRLAQKARGAGIHLIIATQKPLAEVITSLIKDNMPSKVSFNLNNNNGYRTVFGTSQPYHLLGKGDGVMRLEGQVKEFERFQAPAISIDEEEEQDVFDKIKRLYKGEKIEGIEIVEIKEDTPIEKLKRIIANTGETRITEIRKIMKIRSNDVQDLMQQLVEEEWLEEPKTKRGGYTLIASDELLNEWKEEN